MKAIRKRQPMAASVLRGIRSDWMRVLVLWAVSLFLRYLSSLLCLAILVSTARAQPVTPGPFLPGEILQYKVKWSIFRLGTLIIRQEIGGDDQPHTVRVFIKAESTPGLPFIDLYFVNQALLETERCQSFEFRSEIGRNNPRRFAHRPLSSNRLLLLEKIPMHPRAPTRSNMTFPSLTTPGCSCS